MEDKEDRHVVASHIITCAMPMAATQVLNVFDDGSTEVICQYIQGRDCAKYNAHTLRCPFVKRKS